MGDLASSTLRISLCPRSRKRRQLVWTGSNRAEVEWVLHQLWQRRAAQCVLGQNADGQ